MSEEGRGWLKRARHKDCMATYAILNLFYSYFLVHTITIIAPSGALNWFTTHKVIAICCWSSDLYQLTLAARYSHSVWSIGIGLG